MRDNPIHVVAYGDDRERRLRCHARLVRGLFRAFPAQQPIRAIRDGRVLGVTGVAPRFRLFVPGKPNNGVWRDRAAISQRGAARRGRAIVEHPVMIHAKAFGCDGEDVLAGTCDLEAWSLRRFDIDLLVRSSDVATLFDERVSTPAEAAATPGWALTGHPQRLAATALAAISPLL
jgi:hypothetical protein